LVEFSKALQEWRATTKKRSYRDLSLATAERIERLMNARLSSFLNASRWWAAFLVAAHHVRHIVLADASDVALSGALVKTFYFITSLGTQAVMIFFVVSGYLVGGTAIARSRSRGFDLVDYAAKRTSRIYTVLVPALLVGGALDFVGVHFINSSELYTNGAHNERIAGFFAIAGKLDIATLLGNFLMLENILTTHLGTNSPLWSLVYEWWYYCMASPLRHRPRRDVRFSSARVGRVGSRLGGRRRRRALRRHARLEARAMARLLRIRHRSDLHSSNGTYGGHDP
jgi:peptidoglycan/LPS O-acetylase OafA/YrhL